MANNFITVKDLGIDGVHEKAIITFDLENGDAVVVKAYKLIGLSNRNVDKVLTRSVQDNAYNIVVHESLGFVFEPIN